MPPKPAAHASDHRGRAALGTVVVGAGVAALVVAGVMWLSDEDTAPQRVPVAAPAATMPSTAPNASAAVQTAAAVPPAGEAVPLPASPGGSPGEQGQGVFRTDAQGHLVIDGAMRQRAEELLALNEGDALAQRVEAELAALPAPAAAKARELLAQLDAYHTAQRAAFPPGQAPLVPEEGLAQLNTLQAMRVSHFGADAARQMYGDDDKVARRLLELMRDDTATHLSMQDKAVRAQARYDVERGAVRR